jgi:hypothetical protein
VAVRGGGCSGLAYVIEWAEAAKERDKIFEKDGIRVFVDPKSYLYLMGSELRYEETLMASGFKLENPQREGRLRVRRELHGLGSRAVRCWSCQSDVGVAEVCPACGKVQPVAPGTTLFDVLGLPRGVDVDRADLERALPRAVAAPAPRPDREG